MDVHVFHDGVFFVWDSEKASMNLTKHGISFDRALAVFSDPLAAYGDASLPDEERASIVGRDRAGSVLFVIHIAREGEDVRIISARPAEGREVREYENAR